MPKKLAIVWLEDPRQYEYVRVSQFTSGSRSPPSKRTVRESVDICLYKLVGYGPATRVTMFLFTRDIYWLKSYDRGCPGGNEVYGKPGACGIPAEAVLTKDLVRLKAQGRSG